MNDGGGRRLGALRRDQDARFKQDKGAVSRPRCPLGGGRLEVLSIEVLKIAKTRERPRSPGSAVKNGGAVCPLFF